VAPRESAIREANLFSREAFAARAVLIREIALELFCESGYKLAPFLACPSINLTSGDRRMQPESRLASSFSESIGVETEHTPSRLNRTVQEINAEVMGKPRESKLDIVSTAVVIGMTAQFVVFIFGLVTDFIPRMLETILISVFVGLCVGVIAYALMKGND
jgi:hypothetical protein